MSRRKSEDWGELMAAGAWLRTLAVIGLVGCLAPVVSATSISATFTGSVEAFSHLPATGECYRFDVRQIPDAVPDIGSSWEGSAERISVHFSHEHNRQLLFTSETMHRREETFHHAQSTFGTTFIGPWSVMYIHSLKPESGLPADIVPFSMSAPERLLDWAKELQFGLVDVGAATGLDDDYFASELGDVPRLATMTHGLSSIELQGDFLFFVYDHNFTVTEGGVTTEYNMPAPYNEEKELFEEYNDTYAWITFHNAHLTLKVPNRDVVMAMASLDQPARPIQFTNAFGQLDWGGGRLMLNGGDVDMVPGSGNLRIEPTSEGWYRVHFEGTLVSFGVNGMEVDPATLARRPDLPRRWNWLAWLGGSLVLAGSIMPVAVGRVREAMDPEILLHRARGLVRNRPKRALRLTGRFQKHHHHADAIALHAMGLLEADRVDACIRFLRPRLRAPGDDGLLAYLYCAALERAGMDGQVHMELERIRSDPRPATPWHGADSRNRSAGFLDGGR